MQRKEVEYAIRAIPLGGFVAFPDDDPKLAEKYPKDDPNLLKNRPIKDRALVISAGIIANCIFAYSILLAQVGACTSMAPVLVELLLQLYAAHACFARLSGSCTACYSVAVQVVPLHVLWPVSLLMTAHKLLRPAAKLQCNS